MTTKGEIDVDKEERKSIVECLREIVEDDGGGTVIHSEDAAEILAEVARLEGELEAAGDPHALQREAYEWSLATFGAVGPAGPLNHLRREIDEVIAAHEEGDDATTLVEFADCYLLLNDALSRAGLTVADLFAAARRKLEINKRREWGAVNAEGFAEHVRDADRSPAPAAGSEGAVKFSPDRSVACGGAYSDLGHGDCADTREPDVPCACWCHEAAGSEATVSYPLSVLDEGEGGEE
jgi:hypothetical protein